MSTDLGTLFLMSRFLKEPGVLLLDVISPLLIIGEETGKDVVLRHSDE